MSRTYRLRSLHKFLKTKVVDSLSYYRFIDGDDLFLISHMLNGHQCTPTRRIVIYTNLTNEERAYMKDAQKYNTAQNLLHVSTGAKPQSIPYKPSHLSVAHINANLYENSVSGPYYAIGGRIGLCNSVYVTDTCESCGKSTDYASIADGRDRLNEVTPLYAAMRALVSGGSRGVVGARRSTKRRKHSMINKYRGSNRRNNAIALHKMAIDPEHWYNALFDAEQQYVY